MTFKNYFLVLLLGHIIADFYIQSAEMAEKKEKKIRWVLLHSLSYWGGMLVVMLPFMSWNMLVIATEAGVGHSIIDLGKHLYKKLRKKENQNRLDRNTFVMDQILHFSCLFLISYFAVVMKIELTELERVEQFFSVIQISEKSLLSGVLAVLLIYKPADILIQKILKTYRPVSEIRDNKIIIKDNNTGRIIGMIERTIMLVFLVIGQYSSVGLVLTAKSIARYDRIAKEKDFAEYYLLGTLLSTIIVVLSSFVIRIS